MKKELVLTASLFAATLCFGQNTAQTGTVPYDSALAKKLGADEYGMKEYVMVILSTGQSKIGDQNEWNKTIAAHRKNIGDWTTEGKIVFAGPFMQDNDLQEVYILQVKSLDEAKKLIDTDPAVDAGIYSVEYHLWYGPAALQELAPLNKALQKKKLS
jgi:uncharacterized protein YciI